jgi:hypothetical protein
MMNKTYLLVVVSSLVATSEGLASDTLRGRITLTPLQLRAVSFEPKAATQSGIALLFADPRKKGEIEKIIFDNVYLPPRQIKDKDRSTVSVSDFFLTTSIRYKGRTVSETALCDWADASKAAADCKIEDDGGDFRIEASRGTSSKAALRFVIRPKSAEAWGFRVADYGQNEPKAINLKALASEPVVVPIKF